MPAEGHPWNSAGRDMDMDVMIVKKVGLQVEFFTLGPQKAQGGLADSA